MMTENTKPAEKNSSIEFNDFDVSKLSQLIAFKRRSCVLNINCKGQKGVLIFNKGEIVDAEYQGLSVGEATRKLLTLKACDAVMSPDTIERRATVKSPTVTLPTGTAAAEEEFVGEIVDGGSVKMQDKTAIWEKYLQSAATIPGFIWGSIVSLEGEILKISSFDYASEAFAYASILANLEPAKEECLTNIDIGLPATVQIRTKKGAAFFTQCQEKDVFCLTFFAWDAPVETIPAAIYKILQE